MLLLLLLGFACLMITAQIAVTPERMWRVSANMLSELNPDEALDIGPGRIEPLRPEVLTPPPWDPRYILTPIGTAVVVPAATFVPMVTPTPTPGEVAIVSTPSPSPTSLTLTPTQTPTGTPTPTPTSTPTATPTSTPTSTPTPSPTPTATSAPSTSTPDMPPRPTTTTPTPTDTPMPTDTPIPPPSILSITPNWGLNSAPVPVVIRGSNFFGPPSARLGASVAIAISAGTADTLTGTVPAGIGPGVYALAVENPDSQSDILSPAYTAISPDATLELENLVTFGTAGTSPANGDNDQVQVIFMEIPNTFTNPLYVRLYDADVGGAGLFDEQYGGWDTATTFSLYGGSDAYTDPAAQQARFGTTTDPGISSGNLIASQTFTVNAMLDRAWYLFATVDPSQGEAVGDRIVFKLSVVGANGGNDGNRYGIALSTDPLANVAPPGSRIFAYSWTFALASDDPQRLYPYVPSGTGSFEQHNWDMDGASGDMTLHTPIREVTVPAGGISPNNAEAWTSYRVDANEDSATWTVTMDFSVIGPWDDLTFWAQDGSGAALAIFIRPTMTSPP